MRYGAMGWGLALVVASALVAADASAQDDERARMHFQAGASHYEAGEYEPALQQFRRAYELSQKSELFYNFSLCYQQLGDLEQAVEYLRRYLNEVEEIANRANLERRLENFEERLAEERARGEAAPPPEPTEVAPPPPEPPVAPVPAEPAEEGGGIPTLSLAGFIAAGVGVVTMATFGILALSEESSIADGCGATTSCTEDEVGTMDTYALLSDVGLGVAVLGAALGVVGLVMGDDEETARTASVSPFVGPAGAGAAVRGTF